MGSFFRGWRTILTVAFVVLAIAFKKYADNPKKLTPVVQIADGKLQGIESVTRGGKRTYEFRRIPFAKPPLGSLRFEPPQPPEPWKDILDASSAGPQCLQINQVTQWVEGNEDCLYLNVFTPAERKGLLPVMLWLHGGGFLSGSANAYNPAYLVDEDVILVTTNYRLGALGFLNTGDKLARGNQGLKDQHMALQWIQKNIEMFGGDPKQVTLFGESAGSYSVGFHLLSPMSKSLFSRAIMQSGSPNGNWAIQREPAGQATRFAKKFGCCVLNTEEMVNCLRKVDGSTLIKAHAEVLPLIKDKITLFSPSLEGTVDKNTFLARDPVEILKSGNVNKVPLIAGLTKNEGILVTGVIFPNRTLLNYANDHWSDFASNALDIVPKNEQILQKIREFYFPGVKNLASQDQFESFTDMLSDRKFVVPVHEFVDEYRKHAPVHLYLLSYSGEFSLGDILAATSNDETWLPPMVNVILDLGKRWAARTVLRKEIPHLGVCHADELQLLFNWGLSSYISKEHKDYRVSKIITKLWADFAKNSKELSAEYIKWPSIDDKAKTFKYLNIDFNTKLIDDPFKDRVEFWKKLPL